MISFLARIIEGQGCSSRENLQLHPFTELAKKTVAFRFISLDVTWFPKENVDMISRKVVRLFEADFE